MVSISLRPLYRATYLTVLPLASAIIVYGPCYQDNGQYLVSIDSEAPVAYNGSYVADSFVAEECVRFYRSGLTAQQHSITVTQDDPNRWTTLDWIQLVQVSGAAGGSPAGNGSSSSGGGSKSNAGAIAGGVVGGLIVILLVLAFSIYRRRRSRTAQARALAGSDSEFGSEGKIESGAGHSSELTSGAGAAAAIGPEGSAASSFPYYPPSSPAAQTAPSVPESGAALEIPRPVRDRDYALDEKREDGSSTLAAPASTRGGLSGSMMTGSGTTNTRIPPSLVESDPFNAPSSAPSPAPPTMTDLSTSDDRSSPSPSSAPGSGSGSGSGQGQGGVAATLTQVSRDVNRILTQLGHLRITPGEDVDEYHPVMDEIHPQSQINLVPGHGAGHDLDDGTEPPEYGENDGTLPPGMRGVGTRP